MNTQEQNILDALDFSIDELETLEAPGFWKGFVTGVGVAAGIASGIGLGIAIAT